ncbi:MAG: hypothetical protein WCP81_06395 [Actinomycetes bacterium]|jgi:hypothetical protein
MTTLTNESVTESTTDFDVTTPADQAATKALLAKRDANFFNLGYGLLLFGVIMALVVLGLVAYSHA